MPKQWFWPLGDDTKSLSSSSQGISSLSPRSCNAASAADGSWPLARACRTMACKTLTSLRSCASRATAWMRCKGSYFGKLAVNRLYMAILIIGIHIGYNML